MKRNHIAALQSHKLSAELTFKQKKLSPSKVLCRERIERRTVERSRGDREGKQVKRQNTERGEGGRYESQMLSSRNKLKNIINI